VLPEIVVAGIGVVLHVVIPVDDEHEREGPRAVRVPDAPVDRELLRVEPPVLLALRGLLGLHRHEGRSIDGLGLDRDRVAVVAPLLVGAAAVVERFDGVAPAIGGVGRVEQLMGEDDP